MKTSFICFLLLISFPIYSQNSKKAHREAQKAEEFIRLKGIVQERNFEFYADFALPSSGSSISLATNPNNLTFSGDSIYCDMPFFGRAYQVDFDFNGGIDFAGIPNFIEIIEKEKKQKIFIKFKIRGNFDIYNCILTLTGIENASLTINSNNRASISYWGRISKKDSTNVINSK